MKKRQDIVIVGAGVAGLTLAALLSRSAAAKRMRISLLDARSPASFSTNEPIGLRVSAMSVGSLALLATLGIDDELLGARVCPYRDMRVWDAGGDPYGPAAVHFSAAEFALPQLGVIAEDKLLRHCLLGVLADTDVQQHYGAGITALEQSGNGQTLTLENGETLNAALIVGADGARSTVRGLAGIEVNGWQYSQAALVTHARCTNEHQYTAWQRFMPAGPLALLPLLDGRVSIVWSTTPELAQRMATGDPGELSSALTKASDEVLGDLGVDSACASFPLQAQHAHHYVRPGIALIGDAAHTVHPLAGQGANLGLADAAVLASVLDEAMLDGYFPGDLPVLRRYERARRGANGTMLRFIDGLSRLFQADSRWAESLRGAGMQLFERSGAMKRRAMRTALGLDTILPGR